LELGVGAIWALATKDLRLLARDRMDLFFTLIFPLFVAVFFGSIFAGSGDGGVKGMAIAVVDQDQSEISRAFVKSLSSEGEFDVHPAATPEEGTQAVRSGGQVAAVIVPKGFGDAADSMFRGEPARVDVIVDPSRKAETGMVQGLLTKHAFQQTFGDFSSAGKMQERAKKSLERLRDDKDVPPKVKATLVPFLSSLDTFFQDLPAAVEADAGKEGEKDGKTRVGWEPVHVEVHDLPPQKGTGPPNSYAVSFPQAVIWGVMGCALSFGLSLTHERSTGTLTRLMLSPMARWQILAGKSVACFTTVVVVCLLILGMALAPPFRVYPASLPMLGVAILCIASGFVGVMMLLGSLSKTAGGGAGLGRAVMIMLAMVGGGSIPLAFMPKWMQTFSGISPFRWAVQALDGAIWRDPSFAYMATPCAVMLGVGVIGFVIGARVFSWSARA
jgi:ABC-2 type transport system permease protein